MGATAILALCGRFLRCDAAIVFNPLVDLIHESRLWFRIGGWRLPSYIRTALPHIMAQQCCSHSVGRVIVHSSQNSPEDVAQLNFLQEAIQERRHMHLSTTNDQSPKEIPTLEIVSNDTDQHVLPRELKKRDQLLPLIMGTLNKVLEE